MSPAWIVEAVDVSAKSEFCGGASLLGRKHAEATAEFGGIPCLVDIDQGRLEDAAAHLAAGFGVECMVSVSDITNPDSVAALRDKILARFGRVDILINIAANNPTVEDRRSGRKWSRFENLPLDVWNGDSAVGLTGAFLCSQVFGGNHGCQPGRRHSQHRF